MSKIFIYLAGPISGQTTENANDWRDEFTAKLRERNPNFIGVSPLRCEPPGKDGIYSPSYPDERFGTPKVIACKNRMDVRLCHATLAYLPDDKSLGTISEVNWANEDEKPTIIVTGSARVRDNPVIQRTPWIFHYDHDLLTYHAFDQALDVIEGLFEVYTQ